MLCTLSRGVKNFVKLKVAVIGGGNGAFATSADLALNDHDVTMYNRSPEKLELVHRRGGINAIVEGRAQFASKINVAKKIGDAVSGAEWVVVAVPTTAHAYYAELLEPWTREDQTILLNPGHTGGALEFRNCIRTINPNAKFALCETMTLTYITRLSDSGTIQIFRKSKNVLYASLPAGRNSKVEALFPNLTLARNVLETSMSNINAICHPPGMIMNAGWVEHTKGSFLFYQEGFTPSVARVTEAVDRERVEIMQKMKLKPLRFVDLFYSIGSTTNNEGGVYEAMRSSEPNKTIMAPASLDSRYIHEDIGHGLVPMTEFGKIAGVATPIMNGLITLASKINSVDYWTQGRSSKKLGIEGMDMERLLSFVTTTA